MNQSAQPTGLKTSKTPASEDVRLALRAATMYHLEGATQAEIAAKLGVSRPTAGRLLARARSQGLVRVEILVPPELEGSVNTELESELEKLSGWLKFWLSPKQIRIQMILTTMRWAVALLTCWFGVCSRRAFSDSRGDRKPLRWPVLCRIGPQSARLWYNLTAP